jgi:hypothetical protein
MLGDANLSPKTRGIADLSERISRLENYEQWGNPTKLDFAAISGEELWARHMTNLAAVQQLMRQSQDLAEQISHKVAASHQRS